MTKQDVRARLEAIETALAKDELLLDALVLGALPTSRDAAIEQLLAASQERMRDVLTLLFELLDEPVVAEDAATAVATADASVPTAVDDAAGPSSLDDAAQAQADAIAATSANGPPADAFLRVQRGDSPKPESAVTPVPPEGEIGAPT